MQKRNLDAFMVELMELWPQLTPWQRLEIYWRFRWMLFRKYHPRAAAILKHWPALLLGIVLAVNVVIAIF
jgi:hypothetical protein